MNDEPRNWPKYAGTLEAHLDLLIEAIESGDTDELARRIARSKELLEANR